MADNDKCFDYRNTICRRAFKQYLNCFCGPLQKLNAGTPFMSSGFLSFHDSNFYTSHRGVYGINRIDGFNTLS